MELADIQAAWNEMNTELKTQKRITNTMILEITKIKFSNKIGSIIKYEGLGTIILFAVSIFILANMDVFDTLAQKICAVISLFIMISLPLLSLSSIYRMNSINMGKRDFKNTIIEFTKRRSQFLLIQKWALLFSGILIFTLIPVSAKLLKGKDFFAGEVNNTLWFIPIGLLFLFFFGRWGYRCYIKITQDAQDILKELEGND